MHLSRTQIELYHRRTLSPAELLAVDDHVQVCEICRYDLAAGEPLAAAGAAWSPLIGDSQRSAPAGSKHRGWWRRLAARPLPALAAAGFLLALLVGLFTIPPWRAAARRLLSAGRRAVSSRARSTGRRRP